MNAHIAASAPSTVALCVAHTDSDGHPGGIQPHFLNDMNSSRIGMITLAFQLVPHRVAGLLTGRRRQPFSLAPWLPRGKVIRKFHLPVRDTQLPLFPFPGAIALGAFLPLTGLMTALPPKIERQP